MSLSQSSVYTPEDLRNLRNFNIFAAAAGGLFIVATILIGEGFLERGLVAWILVAASILALLLMVRAYLHFLRHADELLRRIQVEGLALGFAAGVVFMLAWRLCERMGALKLDIADGVMPMILFWAIGQYLGHRRYGAMDAEEGQ
jgi:VIT1/CCC1 family predicted Fe2+/Mn2+ transporter